MGFWEECHRNEVPFPSRHIRGNRRSIRHHHDVNIDHTVKVVLPGLFVIFLSIFYLEVSNFSLHSREEDYVHVLFVIFLWERFFSSPSLIFYSIIYSCQCRLMLDEFVAFSVPFFIPNKISLPLFYFSLLSTACSQTPFFLS